MAGAPTDPPEAVVDSWWIETFKRPPDERDAVDMPRLYRAMEAGRIVRLAEMVERMDLDAVGPKDGPLIKEITEEKAKWLIKRRSKS